MPRRAVAVLVLLVAGCGGGDEPRPRAAATPTASPEPTATAAETPRPVATPLPRLRGGEPCPEVPGATCSTLRVPLDRSRRGGETLDLRVGVAGPRDGPVLVILGGGPGEPAVPFLVRARRWLGPEAARTRLVALDQRGTGANALDCPALQTAMGASDLTPPPPDAVRECAKQLGDDRRFYTTADTVADLEALRIALKAPKLAFDGVSYGTYVAQRFALAHPKRVSGLILDSVVPAGGVSMLSYVPMQATRRVLGEPVAEDIEQVVEEQHNGPELLDMLTGLSVGAPRANGSAAALDAAADGNTGPLEGLRNGVLDVMGSWTADRLSQGLHASTLCADTPAPWGGASAPLAGRREALERAARELDDLGPFDRETATGNGIAQQCLHWPPMDVPDPPAAAELPAVPTLLIAGEKDLSTPLEWAQQAKEHAPTGRLITVPGAGHSVQSQGDDETLSAVRSLVASLR